MNLGAIVEVAIGLIFVWIVLSLSVIQIQEWIITRLDKRARDMEDAIHEMLANPNLKAQFYDHPIIRGLTAKNKRKEPSRIPAWFYRYPILRGFTKEKRRIPSYIPSQQFALTLFDITMSAGTESSLIQQGLLKLRDDLQKERSLSREQAVIEELNILIEFARSAAATEAGTAFTKNTLALLKQKAQEFAEKYPNLKPVIDATLEEASRRKAEIDDLLKSKGAPHGKDAFANLRRGIAALSVISPEINQTLNALLLNVEEYISEGETNLARARKNVEKWFDDSMDRLSGAFKRYSQRVALIIGLVLATILNVDSVDLTLYLWREPSVRQALAGKAASFELSEQALQENPVDALQNFRNQFVGLSLPVGWGFSRTPGAAALSDPSCQVFPGEGQSFGVPLIGTNLCIVPPQSNNEVNLATKILGIILTALAARQGAPFWFDILKRVVNLRGTGVNPAEKEGK
ncbi:MAG TPA: hypothetical protein VFY83_06330 [Anaerolineales bacterium]|nr:hypothetical protein [Anaerolineales bacterium]